MNDVNYTVARYLDPETSRRRWAVLHNATSCWYFAKHYGFRAAVTRCAELQRAEREKRAQDRAYQGLDPKFNAALAAVTRSGK